MTYTSINAFGKKFTIDSNSAKSSENIILFAIKRSMSNKINIIFEGKSFSTYCYSDKNKKDFVNAVYDAIK